MKICGSCFINYLSPQGFLKRKGFYAKESATVPNCFKLFRKGELYRLVELKTNILIICYLLYCSTFLVSQILVYILGNIQVDNLKWLSVFC